jgi:hypothetical protein
MLQIYCVKRKYETESKNIRNIMPKNNKPMICVNCITCGTKKFRNFFFFLTQAGSPLSPILEKEFFRGLNSDVCKTIFL